jgi:predicted permease
MRRFWMRRRAESDFADEIESHVALEADRLMAERGMAEDEAFAAARRAFGSAAGASERFYESRRVMWIDRLRADVGFALRVLRRNPGFAAAAVLTLGFGVGLNAAVLSMLYGLILRPLPLPGADRLVTIRAQTTGTTRRIEGSPYLLSFPDFAAIGGRTRTMEEVAAYAVAEVTADGPDARRLNAVLATCSYFRLLRAPIARGRGFAADECAHAGGGAVVVLGDGLWRRRFGADAGIIGRTVRMQGVPLTVVGVAARGFAGTEVEAADAWVPITMQRAMMGGRGLFSDPDVSWLTVIGRMRGGTEVADVRREVAGITRAMDEDDPGRITTPIVERAALLSGPEERGVGGAVAAGVAAIAGLVLLLSCANVATLLLARAASRRREIGIRLAIGAGRWRIVQQMLTESAVLAAIGGALGLALAAAFTAELARLWPDVFAGLGFGLDGTMTGIAAALTLLTVFASGLLPALRSAVAPNGGVLDEGRGGGSAGRGTARLRMAAVGLQLAGSSLLLIVACLVLRGVLRTQALDPGYRTRGIVSLTIHPPADASPAAVRDLAQRVEERMRALPGVHGTARAATLPLVQRTTGTITLETAWGAPREVPVGVGLVSPGYFSTMGLPIVRGRAFGQEMHGGETEAVVSSSLARLLGRRGDAIGRAFRSGGRTYRIAGIAADARNLSLGAPDPAFFYAPVEEGASPIHVLIHAPADVERTASLAAAAARQAAPGAVVDAEPFGRTLARLTAPARLGAMLTGVLGALAALLALVGIYGVASYAVAQRTAEIAIRMALGARAGGVALLVMRQGLWVLACGCAVGAALAAGAAQVLGAIVPGVARADAVALLATPTVLAAVAILAMYLPARRAARLPTARALRVG